MPSTHSLSTAPACRAAWCSTEGGVAAFPATLNKLFAGENFGKLVLKLV